MEILEIKKSQKVARKLTCELCDYSCSRNSDFNKHIMTRKHQKLAFGNKMEINGNEKSRNLFKCTNCNKLYETNCGLWKHNKICDKKTVLKKSQVDTIKSADDTIKSADDTIKSAEILQLFISQSKENQDLRKLLTEQNKILIELAVKNTNSNNTINSHNKTFNLQFFLNEQCKDAMNIMDFVNSMTLQLSDLENVEKLGYVEGISKIMIQKLSEMDIYKRPMHCSDAKRETMYVKDQDKWEKEGNDYALLHKAIKYISKKNSDLLTTWKNKYPASKYIESHVNEQYMRLIKQAMGGCGEIIDNEDKIIKRIAKMMTIGK